MMSDAVCYAAQVFVNLVTVSSPEITSASVTS